MTTFNIGGTQGVGGSGLENGTVTGGNGDDVLAIGVTNGQSGAVGFSVVINDDAAAASGDYAGTVQYINANGEIIVDPSVIFTGIEAFSFTSQAPGTNNDTVDATGATDLTLNTGDGNDTVAFGSGNDSYVIGNRKFGANTAEGGDGIDTLDLSAVTGAQRSDFTFAGTNLHETKALTVTRDDAASHNVTYTSFEVIKSGGGDDTFTSGYAPDALQMVELGAGDDVFSWLTFNATDLDIEAGRGDDVISVGGTSGAGHTGLANGTVNGDEGIDTLALGVTNGQMGATGFDVKISGNGSLSGTIVYAGVGENGPMLEFDGIEGFTFTRQAATTNNDHVDATEVSSDLTLDTGNGNDVVEFGSGDDTFLIGKRDFGTNVTDGGDGMDTLDLTPVTGAQRSDFTFSGTDLFENRALVVTRNGAEKHNTTFTDYEIIKSGGGKDLFTSGYAETGLKTVDMGIGSDVFSWLTFNGDELDIDAGTGNDTVEIGGSIGSNSTGLIDGTVDGGSGTDTLAMRFTMDRGTGFEVIFDGNNSGTVTYRGESGPVTAFENFEKFTFSSFRSDTTNNDLIDASASNANLTIAASDGDDTIIVGGGKDNLTGGNGNDNFVFAGDWFAKDTITDFNVDEDTISLKGGVDSVNGVKESNGNTQINTDHGYITLLDVVGLTVDDIEFMTIEDVLS
ncbi:MAG: beta strand repeat-containing protein [Pikeienuella sp.]